MQVPAGHRFAADVALGILVPLVLARIEPLVDRVPSLGLFRGSAALVLLAVAACLVVGRVLTSQRPGWAAALSKAPAWLLLVSAGMLYAGVGLRHASGLQVSGDEPHYLVMAQSLWRDHDLDLRDEYDGEEWAEFVPGPLRPHWGAARADGRPFPAHSPGLPLLLAPAYAALGREGCVLLMALLAAAAALVCRQLALQLTGDAGVALAAWLTAVGPPLFFYAFHLYTEVPSALAAGGSLLLLLGRPGAPGAALAALAAATLPWLHVKMIPASAALGLIALVRLRGRALAAFLLVAAAAAAGFAGYYWSVFGVATPLALYGGVPADARVLSWRSLAGLFLDRSFGLLPTAPVFLLALAGLPAVLRRREAWPHALVGLAVLAPLVSWRMWWGGQCPPARFLVPMLPFLGVALALRLARAQTGLARWWPGLFLTGVVLSAVAVAEPAARLLLNRGNRPTRLWAALSDGVPIGDYLPTLTHASERDARLALVWLGALGLLLALDRAAASRPRVDRAFSSFAAAVAAVLLLGIVIDLGVGQPGPELPRQEAQAHQGRGATHSIIQGEKLEIWNECLPQHRGREVDGIQRPDWLFRERPACPVDDLMVQVEQDPVLDGQADPGSALCRHCLLDSLDGNGADQHAIALDERQRGAQDELSRREHLTHSGRSRLAQEPGQDRTGLGVDVQRSSRSSSSRRLAAPVGSTGSRGV